LPPIRHPPIKPSLETIRNGSYTPLARPLFLYVNKTAYARPEVKAFVDFILTDPIKIVEHPRVRYVALPDELYKLARGSAWPQGRRVRRWLLRWGKDLVEISERTDSRETASELNVSKGRSAGRPFLLRLPARARAAPSLPFVFILQSSTLLFSRRC